MSTAATAEGGRRGAVPVLFLKTFVHGYVTKDGKAVEGHEDLRPPAPKRLEPERGAGGGGLKRTPPSDEGKEAPMPGAKHYDGAGAGQAPAAAGYKVGQKVRVKGHDGLYEVTKVQGGVAWVDGPDGLVEVKQPGASAPMAKAEAPRRVPVLLLKASSPAREGAKGGEKNGGKPKDKPAGAASAAGGGKGSPPPQKPVVPPRGAPDGEHTMEHADRVAFQHGKVRGEGVIVASGADGVMVQDDAGREHPVRHDNLLGVSGEEETPDELPKDENGRPAATDAAAAAKGKGSESGAKGSESGGSAAASEGEGIEALASMDPGTLGKIMQALKVLAPLFGGSSSKDAAAAKKAKAP